MKKFKFRLSTPLKVKQMLEDIKKQELADAIAAKNREANRLQLLKTTELRIRNEMFNSLSKATEIQELKGYDSCLYKIRVQTNSQRIAVQTADEAYETVRISFIESKRDRQILEKVREKKYITHIQEMNRDEQKQSDESAIISFSRREGDSTDARG